MIRPAVERTLVSLAVALAMVLFARPGRADFSSVPLGPSRAFGGIAAAGEVTAATMQQPHPAVARIIVPEKDGTSYGSGTLVDVTESQGLVITNNHVVENQAGPITVVFPDGFRSQATVLKRDATWDLAALSIWKPNVEPMPIAAQRASPGETLAIAGYGSGDYRMAVGRCTQYVAPGAKHPFEMVEVSAAARQGDSGGPILNQRGELAGVLFGEGDGKTAGSDAGRVAQFLAPVRGANDVHLARLTANRTDVGGASGQGSLDGWRAADGLPPVNANRATPPYPNALGSQSPPADPFTGRIAPSNNSPQSAMTAIDPRFAQPGVAGTAQPNGRWSWPGASGQAGLQSASESAPLAANPDARPSYPLPDAAASSAASPAAATKTTREGDIGSLLGATRFEQAKSILAIFGAIAVIVTFAKGFAKA